jgi:hypothetical protein
MAKKQANTTVRLQPPAFGALGCLARQHAISQTALASRLLLWFAFQPDGVRNAIINTATGAAIGDADGIRQTVVLGAEEVRLAQQWILIVEWLGASKRDRAVSKSGLSKLQDWQPAVIERLAEALPQRLTLDVLAEWMLFSARDGKPLDSITFGPEPPYDGAGAPYYNAEAEGIGAQLLNSPLDVFVAVAQLCRREGVRLVATATSPKSSRSEVRLAVLQLQDLMERVAFAFAAATQRSIYHIALLIAEIADPLLNVASASAELESLQAAVRKAVPNTDRERMRALGTAAGELADLKTELIVRGGKDETISRAIVKTEDRIEALVSSGQTEKPSRSRRKRSAP